MTDALSALRAARHRDDMIGISQAARTLLQQSPRLGGAWGEVAALALEAGDEVSALGAARAMTREAPEHLQSWLWLASVQMRLGRPEAALEALEPQVARHPADGGLHRRIGRAHLALGRTATAQLCFRRALELNPYDPLAWEGLSEACTFTRGDDDIARLEQIRMNAPESLDSEARGVIAYVLAKAYRDIGDPLVAAMRVAEGAAFFRESIPFNIDRHEAVMAGIRQNYDPAFVEAKEDAGLIDARPVFVIAPPQAGADWLAAVLAAGEGEQAAALARGNALFWLNATPLGDQTRDDILQALQAGGDRNVLGDVGRGYLGMAEETIGRRTQRIIDPSSLNEISAGAAGLALPAAKFIRISREPRDLAWSIYRTRFQRARHWTYHPDDIARVLACHNALCAHWDALFPGRVLTLRYEDIAADPAAVARQAAVFAGVDGDAAAAEAWLRSDAFAADPVGVHEEAGARFEPMQAALGRAGLV